MSSPWFRPKAIGVGYTPANAKGWLALLVFIVLVTATIALSGDPIGRKGPEAAAWLENVRAQLGLSGLHLSLPGRLAVVGVEIVAFFIFAHLKSGPPPERLD